MKTTISDHISRAAVRHRRLSARQALAACITLLAFPTSASLPVLVPILTPALLLAAFLLILSLANTIETRRLHRLRDRYSLPPSPPIQL